MNNFLAPAPSRPRKASLDAGGSEPFSRQNARRPGTSERPAAPTPVAPDRSGILVMLGETTARACSPTPQTAPRMASAFLAIHRCDFLSLFRGPGNVDADRCGHASRIWRVGLPAIWPILGLDVRCRSRFDQSDHSDHRGDRNPRRNDLFQSSALVAVGCAVMLVALTSSGARYWRWERLAMALALFNLLFVAVAVLSAVTRPVGRRSDNLDAAANWPVSGLSTDPRVQYRSDRYSMDALLPAERFSG